MSTNGQGLCFIIIQKLTFPTTRSPHTPDWHRHAPQEPPEPSHITATVPGCSMEETRAEESKGAIRPDSVRLVWLQGGIHCRLNSWAPIQLPSWPIIHTQHPFGKYGYNLNSDLLAWPGQRLEPRYSLSYREDPMSSHSSPGWHNPALFPPHSVNSSRKMPQQVTWPLGYMASDQLLWYLEQRAHVQWQVPTNHACG